MTAPTLQLGRFAVTDSVASLWIRPTRQWLAGAGVALLLLLAFIQQYSISERVATAALVSLVIATLLACVEVVATKRAFHLSDSLSDARSTARAWIVTLALVVSGSAAAVQTWFRGDTSIAGIDIGPPDGIAWLDRIFAPWLWSGFDLGSPGGLERLMPWAVILGLVNSVGGSAVFAQRIWYTVLFVASAVGALLLLKTLGSRPLPAALGAAVYVLNAYVVTSVGTSPVYLLALALTVLLPTCVLAAARSQISVPAAAILLGLSAPLFGYVYLNPPLVGMLLAVVTASPLVVWWLWGSAAALRAGQATVLGLGLLLIASAYWTVPATIQLHSTPLGNLSSASSWAWTEVRATINNAFWLNTNWAWEVPGYFSYAGSYSDLPLSVLKFTLPAAAFGALLIGDLGTRARVRKSPRLPLTMVAAASTLALFVLVFSTGTRPPGNWIFDPLYRLPFGWLLREPGRFLMLAGLAYAVLVAAVASKLMGIRLPKDWTGGLSRLPVGSVAATVLVGAVSFGPGFPLIVGSVVPDAGTVLPSMHVKLPDYWVDMTAFIDRAPYDGAVLVLPPDDFYEMPYRWGYYGTDSFIPYLMKREVLVPSPQGYFQPSGALINAVDLTASSLINSNWDEAGRVLQSLRAPLILVRGDINENYPGRSIVPPATLSEALTRAPNFTMIHRAGPLELFAAQSSAQPRLGIAPTFATMDSNAPDLRLLSLLDAGSSLVDTPPLSGAVWLNQAPALSAWQLGTGELHVTLAEPDGWHYRVGLLGSGGPSRVVDPSKEPQTLKPYVPIESGDQSGTQKSLVVKLPLESSLIADGGFQNGPWQTAVGDCAPGSSVSPADQAATFVGGPNGLPALRLAATAGSACEARNVSWQGGPLLATLWIRHVSGAPPRVCFFETGPNRCAPSTSQVPGASWAGYAFDVEPEPGTTGLTMFIYSDAAPPALTLNDYADVAVYAVPSSKVVVIGYPDVSPSVAPSRLLVLHETYSDDWTGPVHTRHVLVDGMINGWLLGPSDSTVEPKYAPGFVVSVGLWLSGATFALLFTMALVLMVRKQRWTSRLRGRRHS